MEPTTTNNAVIQFVSDINERISITIPRARGNVTEPEARTAMQAIIDGGAVVTPAGRPVLIHSAEIVTTERTPIVPRAIA